MGDIEKINLAINLTRITFPFLLFISLASFFSAILNSHNRFAAAAAAPIILNIILVGVLFFSKMLNDSLVYYLSFGVTLAGFLQLIFLYKIAKNIINQNLNLPSSLVAKLKFFLKNYYQVFFLLV